jgi:hypothetical protein
MDDPWRGGDRLVEEKFNCPKCSKTFDDMANMVQHVARTHKLREKYLIIDRENGRTWVENRLPSSLTEKAPEVTVAA